MAPSSCIHKPDAGPVLLNCAALHAGKKAHCTARMNALKDYFRCVLQMPTNRGTESSASHPF